jgi:hypothetical protein
MANVRCKKIFGSVSALFFLIGAAPQCFAAETVSDCGGLSVRFEFNEEIKNVVSGAYPSVPPRQQRDFIDAFCAEAANVKSYFTNQQWLTAKAPSPLPSLPNSGSYIPRTDLQVFISNAYTLSLSLVPAWSAQRGRMLFPASEIIAGEAAIAHELTHVYFPNGNRMLAEGLATYLQHKIGKNPAFPDFGLSLHQLVRDFTCPRGPAPKGLPGISLATIDRIATPDIVSFRVGRRHFDLGGDAYPVAASFVQFLVENVGADESPEARMKRFRTLYLKTPLVPLEREPGEADRWREVFGQPLSALESQWKTFIEGLTCP